jgi:hypothetical protein
VTKRRAVLWVAAAAFLLHLIEGLLIDGPWLLPRELTYANGARSLVIDAPHGARSLASFVTAPLWLASTSVAYQLVKVLGALAIAAAAWPTHVLARELGAGRRAAALAAAAAVVAPATLLASTTLPAALAYPVATWALVYAVRGRRIHAVALLAFAGLVWYPLLWFAAGAALALLGRRVLVWPGAVALVILPAALYAAWHLGDLGGRLDVLDGFAAFAIFVLGLGVVPFFVALSARRVVALLVIAIATLTVASAFEEGVGLAAREGPLVVAVPLVVAAAAAAGGPLLAGIALAAGLAVEVVAAVAADGAPRYPIPGHGPVTVLTAPNSTSRADAIGFWNPAAVVATPPLDRRTYDATTGHFRPPLRTTGRVFDEAGARVDGTPVQQTALGLLLHTAPQARAAETLEGMYPDGWSGPVATYRRFAPADLHTVRVGLSREDFASPDVPSVVQILVGRAGGPLVPRYTIVLHAGEAQQIRVAVPKPPFEVRVTFDPPFSPATYGGSDNRQLGAKISFTYGT